MAGRYGRRYIKDEDFEEEDIWNIMEEKENSSKKPMKKSDSSSTNSRHFSTNYIANPRMIPKSSSSSTNEIAPSKQFSAPLDIPDWSKIYGNTSKKKKFKKINSSSSSSTSWVNVNHDGYYVNNDNDDEGHNEGFGFNDYDNDFDGYGDDDDDDDGMVPPHEYLARKLARSQISSFSVYEGIGRTLKGRDLSKLRNAILTKTGFLE